MAKKAKKAKTTGGVSPAQRRMFNELVAEGVPVAGARILSAIGMAESSGRLRAVNHNTNGTDDFGKYQINDVNGYSRKQLATAAKQAKAAKAISKNGTDFSPWVTYNTGAYKKYLAGTNKLTKAGAKKGAAGGTGGTAAPAAAAASALTPEQLQSLASFQGGMPGTTTLADNPLGTVAKAAGDAIDPLNPLGTLGGLFGGSDPLTHGIGGNLLSLALPTQVEDFFRLIDRLFEAQFWYTVGKVVLGVVAIGFGVNMLIKISAGTSPVGAIKKGATTAAAFVATKAPAAA